MVANCAEVVCYVLTLIKYLPKNCYSSTIPILGLATNEVLLMSSAMRERAKLAHGQV